MTDTNKERSLMELIDDYAEARHVGGCHTYNAKTAEARAKVVASLAASAGSEPVAWGIFDSEGFYEVALDEGSGQRFVDHYNKRRDGPLKPFSLRALYTHPSPPEGAGWRPIETAPKDGTEILLHAPACEYEGTHVKARTTHGHWRAPSDTPRIKYQDGFAPEPEWEDFEPFWASWDGGFTEEHPPTHWMPLPAPPASEAKGA
jgi:hypothetical protein